MKSLKWERTLEPMNTCDTGRTVFRLKWTCSGRSCPPPTHTHTLCLFVSQALPLVLLFDGRLPHWGTGWTEMLAYFLPESHRCYYLFEFLVLVSGWHVKLFKSKDGPPPLCASHHGNRGMINRERGEAILTAVFFLKRQWNTKKAYQPKCTTKLTNKPTKTICSNLKDELFLGALCSFCDFWCHNVFLCICFSVILFPWLIPPLSLTSMALRLSPPEGRKNSLAMYKKEQVKPKMLFLMSFLYCSLVSFFVTVIIWRFPNCTKLHGN